MPIAFSCTCGKEMKAKEAFAGRKIKCPQCDQVVRIPLADGGEQYLPVAPRVVQPVVPPGNKPVVRPSFTPQNGKLHLPRPAMAPLAKPVAGQIIPQYRVAMSNKPSTSPVEIWVDRSFDQHSTPWLPGDKERFQKGFRWRGSATQGLGIGMFLVALGGMAAGWYFYLNK